MNTLPALRGFGPAGLIAIVVILFSGNVPIGGLPAVPVGATLVLLWAAVSGTPWRDLGYGRPRSWQGTILIGVLLGIVLKVVMKAVVMPLLGAPPVNQAFQFLAGNRELLPLAAWAMLVAGFSEETVFRGFVFERLTKLLGTGTLAQAGIVAGTSAWFGAEHYTGQGWPGVQQATLVGIIFGTIFIRWRNIWLLMIAHAAFDLTALAMIYWGLEADFARFFVDRSR